MFNSPYLLVMFPFTHFLYLSRKDPLYKDTYKYTDIYPVIFRYES